MSKILLALLGYAGTAQLLAQPTDRLNSELPPWLRLGVEERGRLEYNGGLLPAHDGYYLNRLRLSLDTLPLRWLKLSAQAEDSRVVGQCIHPAPPSQKNVLDLRTAYVQAGGDEAWIRITAGRQILAFGDGRLLGERNWGNVGRSFDAARLTLRNGRSTIDFFSGAMVDVNPSEFDKPTAGQQLHGAYASIGGLIRNAVVEPYFFWHLGRDYFGERGVTGHLDTRTVGMRWAGKLPLRFDYNVEVAVQRGAAAEDRMRAWMGHWLAGYTLSGGAHKPRVYTEFNYASGDAAAGDGRRGAFDTLFPGSHNKFGLTDLFCASNLVHARGGLQYTVNRSLTMAAAYSSYWVASANDSLYSAGTVWRGAGTQTHVAQEVDLHATWSASRTTRVDLGVGRLLPGAFLVHAGAGVPYTLLYLNVAQRF